VARLLDCLVSYFDLDEDGRAGFRRYFCYHVFAGPGPTTGSGVATVTILAVHDEAERCASCQHFHTVKSGGPEAALATALRYLDAYHEQDHLRRVQSEVRGLEGDQPPDGSFPETLIPVGKAVL
jgi:hypothetical protein